MSSMPPVDSAGNWTASSYFFGFYNPKTLQAVTLQDVLAQGSYDVKVTAYAPEYYSGRTPVSSTVIDATSAELTVTAPLVAPTVDTLFLTSFQTSYTLTGTASTNFGVQTLVRILTADGVWAEVAVTPDAQGRWSLASDAQLKALDLVSGAMQSFELNDLLAGFGSHSIEVVSNSATETLSDISTAEITRIAPVDPSVTAITQAADAPLVLSGTGEPGESYTVYVKLGDATLASKSGVFDAQGTWSFDVSSSLAAQGLGALGAGQYEVQVVAGDAAHQHSDQSSLELSLLARPVAPTIAPVLISGYDPQFSLSGTAASGGETTLTYTDAYGNWYGTMVSVDAQGNWSLGMNSALWYNGYWGATTWGMTVSSLFSRQGSYDLVATTTQNGLSSTDTSLNEVTKLAPPAPTVNTTLAVQGDAIVVSGSTKPSVCGNVDIYTLSDRFVGSVSVIADAQGAWSVDLAAAFANQGLSVLDAGLYEMRYSFFDFMTYTSGQDQTRLELTVLPAPPPMVHGMVAIEGQPVILTGNYTLNKTIYVSLSHNGVTDLEPVQVVSDAQGMWRLDLSGYFPSGLAAAAYEVTARALTTSGTADMSSLELTVLPLPAPTVDTVSVAQGAEIVLGGTALPATSVTLYIVIEGTQYEILADAGVMPVGRWSFNLSEWLAQNDLPELAQGNYDVAAVIALGNRTSKDTNLGELTITAPKATEGDDDLLGTSGDDRIALLGGAGADTFVFYSGDLVTGELIDGGEGFDTLDLLAGAHSLLGVGLAGIEAIQLNESHLTVANISSAMQITAANGTDDRLHVVVGDLLLDYDGPAALRALLGLGVETITWGDGMSASLNEGKVLIHDAARGEGEMRFSTGVVGTQTATTYIEGQRTATLQQDTENNASWTTIVSTYDAAGKLAARVRLDDDGVQTEVAYQDGVARRSVAMDGSDDGTARDYVSLTRDYDASGALLSEVKINDNGLVKTSQFAQGLPQHVEVLNQSEDGSARLYTSLTRDYDANGVLLREVRINDSKLDTITDYENGLRRATLTEDHSEGGLARSYVSLVRRYDASGAVEFEHRIDDNGAQQILRYADGAVDSRATYSATTAVWTVRGTAGDTDYIGNKAADVFVFAAGGVGQDRISGFVDGVDKLNLRAYGVSGGDAFDPARAVDDFDRLGFSAVEQGDDLLLDLGGHGSILIEAMRLSQLNYSDFA